MTISHELLEAFVDGELDEQERARVEAAVAADLALGARVARLREVGKIVAGAYEGLLAAPLPDAVEAAVRTKTSDVVPFARPRNRIQWPSAVGGAAAMAAAFAFAVYSGAFEPPQSAIVAVGGELIAGRELSEGLDRAKSAEAFNVEGGRAQVSLSLVTESGKYCRQFHSDVADRAVDGLACREGDRWRVEIAAASHRTATDGFHPAGAAGGLLDTAIDRMRPRTILNADGEGAAIARGWRHEALGR